MSKAHEQIAQTLVSPVMVMPVSFLQLTPITIYVGILCNQKKEEKETGFGNDWLKSR